jgi:uncharacterized protein
MIKLSIIKLDKEPWLMDSTYMAIIDDLLNTQKVQRLDKIRHHYISTRLQHSLRVSYTAYLNALSKNLDARACARGGLLHDLFFFLPKDVTFSRSVKFIHPRIALRNAKKLTKLSSMEEDIIVHHMWLTGGSTLFDMPHTKEGRLVSHIDKQVAQYEAKMMIKTKWNNRGYLKSLPNFAPVIMR